MKLKRKIFSKNILIFLFYIFFAGGVGFAQNGILSPDSEVSLKRIDGTWKYENGDEVEWNDGSGNLVTDPWEVIVFDTSKAPITVTVSQTCYITNLIIYGDNECTFILNGYEFGINKLYLGSAYTIEGIDESYFDNANKKAGNLKIVGIGSSDNTFRVHSLIDTSSDNNGVANKITVNNTTFTNQSGWNLGNLEDGSLAPEIYGENGTINIGNLTGADDLKNELKSSIGENGSVNVPEIIVPTEAIWEGTEDSSWDNLNNWNAGAVLDGSMSIIIDGTVTKQPEINSNVSITFTEGNNIAFVNDAKLTIGVSGSLTIDSEKFDFQPDGSKITVNGTLNLTKDSPVEYFTIDSHFDSDSTGKIYCSDNVKHLVVATTFSNLNSIEKGGEDGDITIFQNVKCESINANSIIIRKDTAPTVEFDSITADSLQNGGDLTVNLELQISSIINQHKLTIADSVTAINQLSSISNEAELNFNVDAVVEEVTNNQNGKITVVEGKYLDVKKQFSNNGIFTGSIKFTGDNIFSGNNSLGDANSTYTELFINTSKPIQFGGQAVIRTLKVENAESVKFFSAVTINKIDDDGFTGNFYFDATKFDQNAGGLSTSEGFKFNTSGVVYIGKDSNSQISFVNAASPVNFTHTAGQTNIKGSLTANDINCGNTTIAGNVVANEITLAENTIDGTVTGTEITLGKTTLNGNITGTDVEIGDLSLNGTIVANNITLAEITVVENSELKINETSTDRKITLNGNILSTDLKNLTLNGNVVAFCSSINLGALESKGTFTAQNDLVINAICIFEDNVDAKGNLTITGESVFKDAVKSGENLEITGNATFESTEKSVEVGNNLKIEGDEITINGAVIAGKSDPFTEGSILLTGTTKITANSLFATKDITLKSPSVTTENIDAKNDVEIEGNKITTKEIKTTNDITLNGNVIETSVLNAANNIAIQGTTIKTAALIATENIFINKDSELLEQTLNITGDVSANNFESVAKTQTFDGTISVTNLKITGNAGFENTVTTGNNLTITGDSKFSQNVVVENIATLQGDVEFLGTLSITQDTGYLLLNGIVNQEVKLNANDTYKKIVVEKASGDVEINNAATITNFENTTAETTTFNAASTITNYTNTKGNSIFKDVSKITSYTNESGKSTFEKDSEIAKLINKDTLEFGAKITSTESVENNGIITINGESTIKSLKNTSELSEVQFNQTGNVESIENRGNIFVNENVSAKNVENEGKITIAVGKIFAISETLKDNNEIGGDGTIKINGTGNQDVTLTTKENIGYKNIVVEKESGDVEINNTATIENFENATAGTTIFNAAATITNYTNTKGNSIFKEVAKISSYTNESGTTTFEKDVEIAKLNNKENVKCDSKFTSSESIENDGTLTVYGESNINSLQNGGNATFEGKATITSIENTGTITTNSESEIQTLENFGTVEVNGSSKITTLKNKAENANVKINAGTTFDLIENAGLVEINENSTTRSLKNTKKIHIAEGRSLTILEDIEDSGEFSGTGALRFTGNAEQLITLKENANYPHIVVDKDGGKITFTNAMTVGLFETENSPETIFENKMIFTDLKIQNGTKNLFKNEVEITSFEIATASETKFGSNVSVGTFTDKADSGIYIFNKDASFATETIFNTTETVFFGSDENSTTIFGTEDNPVNFMHTAGKTLITGNLFANDVTLSETEISGTVNANDINCGNTTIAGNVVAKKITLAENTIDGTVTGTEITLGKTTLNGNITGTDVEIGDLSLNGTIVADNITLAEINVVENSELKINETSTDRKITLNGNILSTDLKNLTLNGNVDVLCSSINLGALESKGTFTAQNDLVINAVSIFGKTVDAKENFTINGTSAFNQTVEVGNNLTINGNANFANTVITGNNFTIEGDEITINGAVIAGKSDPFTEGSILLTGTTKITANSLTATKDITLNANVIETADLIATENVFINKDSEVLDQTLNITGDVSSNNFESVAKTQTFGGEIFVAKDFTSEGETFTFADKVTVNQNAQIQNTGLLKISDFVYGKSFVQKGSEAEIGQVMISGSFVQSGESEKPTATFGSNVYFYNSSENLLDITIGSDKSSILIDGNLIIAKSKENDVAIKGTVKSNNFALYSGNVDLSGNLSTKYDVVVLGENYSLKDDQTGIENLYSYNENRPGHWSQASYTFETSLPDGTEISQNYAGTVKVLPEKSITVGKNLYANGTVFALYGVQGSGKWKLNVPDTSDAEKTFCEVYNSEVSDCDATYQIAALQCTDKSGNINWAFDDDTGTVKITKAYSVSDNVIRVEFIKPVRILKDRFTQKQMRFSNGPDENHYFENVYLDEKCTKEASEVVNQYYEENGSKNYFVYVKANSKWNTDATGTFVGEEKSTDYDGVHQNTTICLDFPRAITTTTGADENLLSYIITDLWGKRLTNYSARTTSGTQKIPFENVEDKTGPVLISVKTGQENHTEYDGTKGAQSQPSYDSHNFIEFVYSEFVNFGSENSNGAEEVFLKADDQGIENAKNIQVTQKFGALQNEDITQSGELKFAGLAKIQNGKIYTGSQNNQGNADKYVNALYRFDKYSLRYSIAGYTHPTEFVQDDQGNNHKKWIGYIQEAELPTGTVSMICDGKNDLVFDMAGNSQTLVKNNLTVDSSKSGVYGNWDISKPIFAPLRMKSKDDWSYGTNIEALGNNSGFGSTIDRIEFHLFDNTPDFTESDEYSWITERGWCYSLSSDLYTNYSYAADIFGGSRPFIQDEKYRTSGGIRFSSLENASKGFLYTTNSSENPKISFDNSKPVIIGANAKLFTGKSSTRHLANKVDGLYFSLLLKNDDMDLKTVFTISYNDELAFITDLAGNRLLGKTVRTVDRTSPSLNVVLSPINQKDFYVSFLKSINEENLVLVSNDEKELEVTESIRDLLPQCFEIIKINNDGSFELADIQVDKSVVAQKIDIVDDKNYTVYKMSLTRNVSLEDVKKLHVRIVNPEKYDYTMRDPVTNIQNSLVTLIQDNLGNYIDKYQTHSLSDIAINAIVPLYAFSSSINEENLMDKEELPDYIKMQNSNFSVRDWDRDQQNYGTLLTGKEISIIAELNQDETSTTQIHDKFRIFLSNADNLVSEKFNREIGGNLRIWFPDIMEKSFNFFSLNKNKKYETTVSSVATSPDVEDCLRFDLPFDMTNKWKSGDQISFIFSILNDDNSQYCIYPAPIFDVQKNIYTLQKSAKFPLFAIRMENPQDITTLDLWSFRLKNLTEQRGGVSILNNVINATYGEKAVVKVNVPQDSNVDVIVMTLDGNIVTYLQHGAISSGEHYFTWNGTNMSGTKVARGLYFVRVIGPKFDETRKVMVVKD